MRVSNRFRMRLERTRRTSLISRAIRIMRNTFRFAPPPSSPETDLSARKSKPLTPIEKASRPNHPHRYCRRILAGSWIQRTESVGLLPWYAYMRKNWRPRSSRKTTSTTRLMMKSPSISPDPSTNATSTKVTMAVNKRAVCDAHATGETDGALARVAPAAAPASHERCRLRRHGSRSMATPRELLRIAGRTKQGLWHKCWLLAGSFDGGCVAHHGYRIPIPHKFGSPRVDDVPRLLLDFASCLLLLLVCAPCPHRHLAFAFLLGPRQVFGFLLGHGTI